jgi:hypothetical protein
MRLLLVLLAFCSGCGVAVAEPASPLRREVPTLQSDPLGSLRLGGSTFNFEGDRKPPDTLTTFESLEPGTIGRRRNNTLGPQFFGLSVKKPLEY